ncbi:MAG: AI-2E family transporter [Oscillospiraceae bacterium]|jgi:predicted PurR-regulated permease PerM|nr:AI-2E family transporter [Oscillospiraceae bacterium]
MLENKDKHAYRKTDMTKTIIFCGVVLILFIVAILYFPIIWKGIKKCLTVFRPILIGGVIALILNAPVNKLSLFFRNPFNKIYDNQLRRYIAKQRKKEPVEITRLPFIMAIVLIYILVIAIIAVIINFVVPQLIDSVQIFSENFDSYYNSLQEVIMNSLKKLNSLGIEGLKTEHILEQSKIQLNKFAQKIPGFIPKAGAFTANIVRIAVDVILGIIFSIYILSAKHELKINAQKLSKKLFSPIAYKRIHKYTSLTVETFANFFNGQLLEAYILAMLCFIGMTICGFEYAVMISVIIGISNLIPIVGPFIGTIPSFLLILLVNPSHALLFLLFIVALQQFESNIIYPRVVGSSVGLPALWVLFAVIVGGGFFNIIGMLIGIPFMSVIYSIVKDFIDNNEPKETTINNIGR